MYFKNIFPINCLMDHNIMIADNPTICLCCSICSYNITSKEKYSRKTKILRSYLTNVIL